jgi:hypothetical protein
MSVSNDNICGAALIELNLIEWILIPVGFRFFYSTVFCITKFPSDLFKLGKIGEILICWSDQSCTIESRQTVEVCCFILYQACA